MFFSLYMGVYKLHGSMTFLARRTAHSREDEDGVVKKPIIGPDRAPDR